MFASPSGCESFKEIRSGADRLRVEGAHSFGCYRQRTAIPMLCLPGDFHGDRQGVGNARSGGPIGSRDGPGEILH